VSHNVKLAVLSDESTTAGTKTALAVQIKADVGNSEPVFIFLELIELVSQTAQCITSTLLQCLKSFGFIEEYLLQNWIAFASDGASVIPGKPSGVSVRLCASYPNLFIWDCLNHRLELADAIDEVNAVNHFKSFVDCIYCLYSQSPKNQ
jgi:hypothetical protein